MSTYVFSNLCRSDPLSEAEEYFANSSAVNYAADHLVDNGGKF